MGNFNVIFRNLRLSRGFTQKDIADRLGISKSAVSMYENGSRVPDLDTLKRIADILQVNLDELSGHHSVASYALENPYQDMKTLIARGGKQLTTEEKMKLIQLLSNMD